MEIRRVDTEDREWKRQFSAFFADTPAHGHILKFPHAYFAAYNGREIVGHSVVYKKDGRWIMDGLRVKPEYRQQGIASSLTRARIRYAIDQGDKEVWYSCHDDNLVTICCHLRFGFKEVCAAPHHAEPGHWYRLKVTKTAIKKYSL